MEVNMISRLLLGCLLIALTSCHPLGKNWELSGIQVDSGVLAEVTRITGVTFPQGTQGMNFFYQGKGMDHAFWLKIVIPGHQKEGFLQNSIFREGEDYFPTTLITLDKAWWKLNNLAHPTVKSMHINGNEHLVCAIGDDLGTVIVYLHWLDS